eukprot:TRINITY_DN444_c0_g1_i1.p1 TRINITY_DN444_c0_g1~~TRINITY_DN444_c0_g1_i1.p1  ORF type:complete len:541 (-),score=56.77 TRINITY_DN444_c0_g1_i1:49-1671(-)
MMSWAKPAVTSPSPSARCAHTAVLTVNLYIFGGWNGTRMLADLHVLHPDTMTWSRPVTTGDTPSVRAGHTTTGVGTKLFVFGGGNGYHYLNDLYILDTETMTWSRAYVTGTSPAARSRHTATLVGTKLFVIGGGDDSRVYNDVYILDTETMSWSRPEPNGTMFVARWGHTATMVGNKLYVFGGHDGQRMLNDLNILDPETMTWSQSAVKGVIPTPRAGHTANMVADKLIFFGGGDGVRMFNELYILDPSTLAFTRPTLAGVAPTGRCAHTTTLWEGKLLIFGGGDGGRRFKDLYVLDAESFLKNETDSVAKKKSNKRQQKRHDEKTKTRDIASWLESCGMKKYYDLFVREEIDISVLPYVTEQHLEKIGVTSLGARLQLVNAINQYKQELSLERKEGDTTHNEQKTGGGPQHQSTDSVSLKHSLDALTNAVNRLTEMVTAHHKATLAAAASASLHARPLAMPTPNRIHPTILTANHPIHNANNANGPAPTPSAVPVPITTPIILNPNVAPPPTNVTNGQPPVTIVPAANNLHQADAITTK